MIRGHHFQHFCLAVAMLREFSPGTVTSSCNLAETFLDNPPCIGVKLILMSKVYVLKLAPQREEGSELIVHVAISQSAALCVALAKRVAGGPPSPEIKEKNMCHPRSPIQVLTGLNVA